MFIQRLFCHISDFPKLQTVVNYRAFFRGKPVFSHELIINPFGTAHRQICLSETPWHQYGSYDLMDPAVILFS